MPELPAPSATQPIATRRPRKVVVVCGVILLTAMLLAGFTTYRRIRPTCQRTRFGHGPVQLAYISLEYLGASERSLRPDGTRSPLPLQSFRVLAAQGGEEKVVWWHDGGDIGP